MEKKFLLISQVFYPDQVSTANLFTNLCEVLASENIDVEVWSAHPSYTEFKRQPGKLNHNGVNIKYLPSTNFNKNNIAGRLMNILTFLISASFKLFFSIDKTPVWTHTTPPFLGIIISKICHYKKRKFVYILLDVFPEGLVRIGKFSRKNIFIQIWQQLFQNALKRTDKIVVIGRDTEEFIKDICPECHKRILYIPHWQDETLVFPINSSANEFASDYKLNDKFVIQYSGNMGLWNEIATMGKAVKRNPENVFFVFVGGGIRKLELLREFSIADQKNVLLLPFQQNNVFNKVLNASDIQIVTLLDTLAGMAVPCKIYGILAAAKPVIAMVPQNSEIAYIVKEENCGLVLKPTDLDGLLNAISYLKENPDVRISMGQNSRKAFETKYTTRIIAEKYQELLDSIMQ